MLYKRIIEQGTINEPEGKPDPQFALPSTVNWMRAVRLLISEREIDFRSATQAYAALGKREMSDLVQNTVLEQLFLSLHHLSSLDKMKDLRPAADFCRIGILAWYYGISNAASAMIAAQNGSFQEDHSGTARLWDLEIAARNLALPPFDWRVSSLLEAAYKPELDAYRGQSTGTLLATPMSIDQARGAACAYLSGSAKWYAWRATEEVRRTTEFKQLNVDNFRTKAARELRDKRLAGRSIGFVHQAFRYRGKANYREALFLAYGRSIEPTIHEFLSDQTKVLKSFVTMAGAFAARKLGRELWNEFVMDVEANRAFSMSVSDVWR
ncbi:hypothetical protein [Bradyrhizobium sp. Bra64]|uniref:hypothetical protein n=1 Tax=Bradyrhizobium sp. Bra64 TaxID=2926009 RepID=UPI0021172FE2|nr:hypothetical protein [Bradyrhizobium sp. Bra64]